MGNLIDNLEKKYEFRGSDESLGEGNYAKVYRLNEDLAVKIPIDEYERTLTFEDEETRKLSKEVIRHFGFYNFFINDKDVNIVEPKGIYALKNLDDEKYYPGFVMNYLDGTPLKDMKSLDGNLTRIEHLKKEGILPLAIKQWEKIHGWGINPVELDFENTFWIPKEGKVYSIDLDGWNFLKEKKLRKTKGFFDGYK